VWDQFGHIIAEHTSAGGVQREYIWLGDTPLAVFDGANLFYVHPDHLDRPVMMTNAAAQTVAWQAKYDPFGNAVTVTVSPVNNQRLPGQWYQIEDGLAYNWHRTYDATLGRYSQADPLGFVDGPGVYGYAGGSPVMGVDPRGLNRITNPLTDPRLICIPMGIAACMLNPVCQEFFDLPRPPMMSKPPRGLWPADEGAKEWGRRNEIPPKEAKDRFHRKKKKYNGSRAADDYKVNPDTGDIVDPDGEYIDNLGE
jgi:RHS repeat-associated protein